PRSRPGRSGRGLVRAARCSRSRSLGAPFPAGCPDHILMLVDASTVVNAWRRVEGMPISLPLVATDTGGCCAPVTGGVLAVEDAQQLARMFKALGDPTRVRLLSMITAQSGGEACVCNLTEPVGLSQPTVSHHMKQLVDAGLVTRAQRGKWAYYAVVPEILGSLKAGLLVLPEDDGPDFRETKGALRTAWREFQAFQARSPIWRLALMAVLYTVGFMVVRLLLTQAMGIFQNVWIAGSISALVASV